MLLTCAVLLYARAQSYDRVSLLLILAAIGLYYFHFFHARWDEFTLDAATHAEYLIHIARSGDIPSLKDHYNIVASRHPPTYYFAGAMLYRLAEWLHEADPLQVARNISMLCYLVFILFGVALLRRVLAPRTPEYYCAVAMFLFWPIGVTMGARITCDPLLYAGQAGVLYFLTRWNETRVKAYLSAAFLAAGVSILAKNGGILMLYIALAVLGIALWQERRQWRSFLRLDLAASILFAVACYYLTRQHGWVTEQTPGAGYNLHLFVSYITGFNPFLLVFDTSLGLSQNLYWNMFLHTLLLGDATMPWKNDFLLTAFNILWAAVILYLLMGARLLPGASALQKKTLFLFGSSTACLLSAMLYMLLMTNNIGYADGRYLYPAVIGVTLSYGVVMHRARTQAHIITYRTGLWLATGFVLLSWALFFSQYEMA